VNLSPSVRGAGVVLLALLGGAAEAQAAGVVGNGTPASCTEAAFSAALAGGGSVTFSCGGGPVVIPITSTKTLTTTTTIDGAGQNVTLDGLGATRLFRTTYQFASFTLTFRNLTMRNGRAPDFGGGIRLAYQDFVTTLVIENVVFENNVCDQAANDVGGGALYAQGGIVTIRGSRFTGNRGGNGGAIGNLQARFTIENTLFEANVTNPIAGQFGGVGGAIYIDGSGGGQLVIRSSTFRDNVASRTAGAIHTYLYAGGTGMTIEDSTFEGNSTQQNGGAIYHQNGALTIARSTFANNTTRGQGGALWLLQAAPTSISNSTFTGNSATGIAPNNGSSGLGGAILINASNTVTISHTTIANNHADWVGGGITGGMGGGSTTTLRGTIVAHNTAANGGNSWNIAHNCSTQLLDGGGNLQFPTHANPSDPNDPNCTAVIAIGDPLLAPLASNGGPTQTRALLPGSPARNRVTSGCPPPSTDQRGVTRPQGTACDSGAYEAAPVVTIANLSEIEGTIAPAPVIPWPATLSEPNTQPVTVQFQLVSGTAVAPADYVAAAGLLSFAPGTTTGPVVPLDIVEDALDEDNETFTIVLSNPVNASVGAGGVVTILDDDAAPTMSAVDCIAAEGTGPNGSCTLTASLSAVSGKQVTVAYATMDGTASAPIDYTSASGVLAFAPGVSMVSVPISLVGDALDESDESFVFNLSSAQNATLADAQGLVTIDDDDGPTLTVSTPSVLEGNAGTTQAGFTLSLSATSVQPVTVAYVTVDGTASVGQDYQLTSGTVTFPSGTTGQSVNVPVIGDVLDEPNETFYLALGPVSDATPVSTTIPGIIRDDDGTTIALQSLGHGTDRRETLEGGADLFVLHQPGRTSWEVVVDAASGDVGNGAGPVVQRVGADLTTVVQSSSAAGSGPARVLRWTNASGLPQDGYVRVSSAGCGTDCGSDDVYRVRAYETTGRIARFNASGSQVTVVVLQNVTDAPISATVDFWSPSGALLDTRGVPLPARSAVTLNVSTVPGAAGQSGSMTVTHDGGYGAVAGKSVALDVANGFSFDTPLTYRPR
jgi:predicted outer membrane repeat protein